MSDATAANAAHSNSPLASARNELLAPFDDSDLEFLPRGSANGRALALAHVDARAVMGRLDSAVGTENWSFDYEVVGTDCKHVKGILTVCGVTKCDAGEAKAEDELLKAAVSDALKRCAVHFGVGRYLYYLPQQWAEFDAAKRRFTQKPSIAPQALAKALAAVGYVKPTPAPPLRIVQGTTSAPVQPPVSDRALQAVKASETTTYGEKHGLVPTLKDERQRFMDNAAGLKYKGAVLLQMAGEALNRPPTEIDPKALTREEWTACADYLQKLIEDIAADQTKAHADDKAAADAWQAQVGEPPAEALAEAPAEAPGSVAAQIAEQAKGKRTRKPAPKPEDGDPFVKE